MGRMIFTNAALDGIGCVFLLVPFCAYAYVLYTQFHKLTPSTHRIQVLSTRAAVFLPIYALMIYIAVLVPETLRMMEIPLALLEGYCFYCFFALVVTNMGGPEATIAAMEQEEEAVKCACCCPREKREVFKRATRGLFHFLFTRSAVVALATIVDSLELKLISAFISIVSFAVLINGVLSVLVVFENILEPNSNLFGLQKFVLMKVSVGLIAVQGLVEQFLSASGNPYDDDSEFSAPAKLQRGYCMLVLLEFLIIAPLYAYTFGATMTPSPKAKIPALEAAGISDNNNNNTSHSSTVGATMHKTELQTADTNNVSFFYFVSEMLSMHDILLAIQVRDSKEDVEVGQTTAHSAMHQPDL